MDAKHFMFNNLMSELFSIAFCTYIEEMVQCELATLWHPHKAVTNCFGQYSMNILRQRQGAPLLLSLAKLAKSIMLLPKQPCKRGNQLHSQMQSQCEVCIRAFF